MDDQGPIIDLHSDTYEQAQLRFMSGHLVKLQDNPQPYPIRDELHERGSPRIVEVNFNPTFRIRGN